MGTITTKQLRENMGQVVRDLQNGKAVQLSYRHKVIGVIQPAQHGVKPLRRGSSAAILDTLRSVDFGVSPSKSSRKSFKQEVRGLRNRDLAER